MLRHSNIYIIMAKFRKRPVIIEAVQWLGDNTDEILLFLESDLSEFAKGSGRHYRIDKSRVAGGLIIKTLEGEHLASPGDWIIKGVEGEYYPCKPDIFKSTYEALP